MPPSTRFKTGAIPTPRHKLAAAMPFRAVQAPPPQVIVIPPFLEMWLNDQYGDCVTAEEAFAKAAYSVFAGLPETRITDATVLAFCNAYGFLNGANLTDVMDKMISAGFHQDQGYKDGPYNSVDYSNETVLQGALAQGPVKIGIDSQALPSGAGNTSGWSASGGSPGQYTNEDHCVALCGYGPSTALFGALHGTMPGGFPASGYLLYTWSTIGVVDHAWIMSTCGEAWLRNPTTPGVTPTPPLPPGPGAAELMVSQALAAGTYPCGPGTITLSTAFPAGSYPVNLSPPPVPPPPVPPPSQPIFTQQDFSDFMALAARIQAEQTRKGR